MSSSGGGTPGSVPEVDPNPLTDAGGWMWELARPGREALCGVVQPARYSTPGSGIVHSAVQDLRKAAGYAVARRRSAGSIGSCDVSFSRRLARALPTTRIPRPQSSKGHCTDADFAVHSGAHPWPCRTSHGQGRAERIRAGRGHCVAISKRSISTTPGTTLRRRRSCVRTAAGASMAFLA